ncbi:MAG: hypothetical protein ACXW0Z_17905 [Gemmatirosa sp.]
MRCERCGEHEATVNLTMVRDGAVTQEHLCEACARGGADGPASPERVARWELPMARWAALVEQDVEHLRAQRHAS